MPIHNSHRVEFAIDSGHIKIVTDKGHRVPAYWAHPQLGQHFSGICLLHDWWGSDTVARLLTNFFAQMGYYVIAPDMFDGMVTRSPAEAMKLVKKSEQTRYSIVDTTLSVLDSHHRVNDTVATVGIGMGGTLAMQAAIERDDLEASVAYGGFPQQLFGRFHWANTPLLALYGDNDPFIKKPVVDELRKQLAQTAPKIQHQVMTIEGAGHSLFSDEPDEMRHISKQAINHTLAFLEQYLIQPIHYEKKRF